MKIKEVKQITADIDNLRTIRHNQDINSPSMRLADSADHNRGGAWMRHAGRLGKASRKGMLVRRLFCIHTTVCKKGDGNGKGMAWICRRYLEANG